MMNSSTIDIADIPLLSVERLTAAEVPALTNASQPPLGTLVYGTTGSANGASAVHGRVLSDAGPMADVWRGTGPTESGITGNVHWRRDEHWLFGAVELDEAAHGGGLEPLAYQAYRDVFKALAQTGYPHLLRIWNHLPHINADGGGLERYRQFNLGRQQAFLDAGQTAFDGAPAACGIGTLHGPLCVRFLAGRTGVVPIENPRQLSAYHYPQTYGPRAPTFSRAALAEIGGRTLALFISGTASIVGHESLHVGNVEAQTHETLRNLRTVITAAQAKATARFGLDALDCVVYLRHVDDAPVVRQVLDQVLGPQSHTVRHAVYLEADICRSDLLVEIEAHAVAAGKLRG